MDDKASLIVQNITINKLLSSSSSSTEKEKRKEKKNSMYLLVLLAVKHESLQVFLFESGSPLALQRYAENKMSPCRFPMHHPSLCKYPLNALAR